MEYKKCDPVKQRHQRFCTHSDWYLKTGYKKSPARAGLEWYILRD
jgi:hypothetical protein